MLSFSTTMISVMAIFGIASAMRGFFRDFLDLTFQAISLYIAFLVTTPVYHYLFLKLADLFAYSPHQHVSKLVIGTIIFLLSLYLLTIFIKNPLNRHLKSVMPSFLNISLGFLFGFIKGFVMLCLVLIFVTGFLKLRKYPNWLADDRGFSKVLYISKKLSPMVGYIAGQSWIGKVFNEKYSAGEDSEEIQQHSDRFAASHRDRKDIHGVYGTLADVKNLDQDDKFV